MSFKICLTGCFDRFHDAHRKLLERAAKMSQRGTVHVLINTDSSVKRLKGDGRPKDNLTTRQMNVRTALLGLRDTDIQGSATLYAFDTEEDLIKWYETFNPDFILHGDDITDLNKVTGFPRWPVMICARGTDEDGKDISSTEIIRTEAKE